MAYRIYDWYDNTYLRHYDRATRSYPVVFDSWWDLIGYIKSSVNLDAISHNRNDRFFTRYPIGYYDDQPEPWQVKITEYCRSVFILDEYNRIINLHEIREGLKEFRDDLYHQEYKHYYSHGIFRYRHDPVPRTGHRWHCRCYRSNHSYKNYYLNALSYVDDARLRNGLEGVTDWDGYPRFSQRSWKEQSKKRKQWM